MTNDVLEQVLTDLEAEGGAVEALVAGLDEAGWRSATPAEGWDIATTVAHLLWTDETSVKAIDGTLGDKTAWDEVVMKAFEDPAGFVDTEALALAAGLSGAELLTRWQVSRRTLGAALREVPTGQKLMWFGPPMSAASMATARLMETWAHGLDVAEALKVSTGSTSWGATDRIRHVASIGFRTRNYSFKNNGLEAPAEEFRLELKAPSGEVWAFGPEDAAQTVRGSSYDFCALVTQRLNRADTDLVAHGADAEKWLDIAQCFAGPAGGGRAPRSVEPVETTGGAS